MDYIEFYDGTRHLIFFGSEKYDAIYDGIRYIISLKAVSHVFFFSLLRKNQSWFLWFFTYRKILTLHNIIIPIKSVLNKDKN